MERTIIIEIHDRFGKVKNRHRVSNFPFTIGRGYDCDLILDDKYTSAQHITLDFDSEDRLIATDANSENGMYAVSPLKRVDSMWLKSGSRLRIGHTELQFMFPDHPIKEVIPDRSKPGLPTQFFTNWPSMVLVWLLTLGLLYLNQKLEMIEKTASLEIAAELLPIFVFMGIWAGSWAIASKIVTHRSYFGFHAMLIGVMIFFSSALDTTGNYIEFSFMLEGTAYLISIIGSAFLFAAILFGHIRFGTTASKKKALRIALSVSLGVTLLSQAGTWFLQQKFTHELAFSKQVKPPYFVVAKAEEPQGFFESINDIKKEIDRTIAKSK